jgi:hypothetical protein
MSFWSKRIFRYSPKNTLSSGSSIFDSAIDANFRHRLGKRIYAFKDAVLPDVAFYFRVNKFKSVLSTV